MNMNINFTSRMGMLETVLGCIKYYEINYVIWFYAFISFVVLSLVILSIMKLQTSNV
jgi:hypothetical protein